MVMVPMFDVDELDELVWPRPELRVIAGGRDEDAATVQPLRRPSHRRPSARVLRRRRQVVGLLAATIVALAFWALSAVLPSPLPVGAASTMARPNARPSLARLLHRAGGGHRFIHCRIGGGRTIRRCRTVSDPQ